MDVKFGLKCLHQVNLSAYIDLSLYNYQRCYFLNLICYYVVNICPLNVWSKQYHRDIVD